MVKPIHKHLTVCSLLVALVFSTAVAAAASKIYRGNSTSYSNIVATLKGDKVYRGNSTNLALASSRGSREAHSREERCSQPDKTTILFTLTHRG